MPDSAAVVESVAATEGVYTALAFGKLAAN